MSTQQQEECDLLLDRFRTNVQIAPTKVAVSFLTSNGTIERSFTYKELDDITTLVAYRLLQQYKIPIGDRVVLVYPPSLDFMISFIACCKVNLIAVPVFPPNPSRKDSIAMFCKIVQECKASYALTNQLYNYNKKLTLIKDTFIPKFGGTGPAKTMSTTAATIKWPDTLQWIVTDTILQSLNSKQKGKDNIEIQHQYLSNIRQSNEQISFLQFTSGSTSDPKGVMISHGNLGHNLTIITNELQAKANNTIVVSWLPQYHDMGLIGSYLGVLYCGGTGYYMSPLVFLQNPSLWIECISKYKATHLQAPNFAFKLTSRKFDPSKYTNSKSNTKRIELDLSSVRHIINAAEPVDVESMRVFYETFTPFGLLPNVIFPTYGLAEHTVFVCSGGKQVLSLNKHELETNGIVQIINDNDNNSSINVSTIVGCGYPAHQNVDVKIVKGRDDDDADAADTLMPTTRYQIVSDDIVGEVWVSSPSKAAGYYNKPNETQHDFFATVVDDELGANSSSSSSTKYLRTGDLGFLHNGELFICGRLKDLIIIGGRNYYPQDIEATAEATLTDTTIRSGCSAAFTINTTPNTTTTTIGEGNMGSGGGGEEVALIMELRNVPVSVVEAERVCDKLANQVKSIVTQEHSLGISVIIFVKPKTVPKTSSGKIARSWCRKAYLNKTLQIVYEKSYSSPVASTNAVSPLEIDNAEYSNGTSGGIGNVQVSSSNNPNQGTVAKRNKLTAEQVRAMEKVEIAERLLNDIAEASSVPPSSIDKKAAIATVMDSLSLSQFKGMFEANYHIQPLSDEYLLRDTTSIVKLSEVVKLGYAPDDNNTSDVEGGGGAIIHQDGGKATGLAGALGCPPGVVCIIL